MYACLSYLFFYNDICCSMYLIKIMVVMMMMMFVGLRPKTNMFWNFTQIWLLHNFKAPELKLRPNDIGITWNSICSILIPKKLQISVHRSFSYAYVWLVCGRIEQRIETSSKYDANLVITWSRNPHAKTSIPGKPSKSGLIGV
jgi:hypothetical protein